MSNDIRLDLKEMCCGVMNGIALTLGKLQYKDFAKMILNHRGL
jgi:hypothetical protein